MSVQFGRWNLDRKPVDASYLEKVKAVIASYGPDGGGSFSGSNIELLYRAFHTTKESRREIQPHISPSGAVITWDGCLDNREELLRDLQDVLTVGSTDVELVAAAYEKWGTDAFARLLGDWALAIWNANVRSLILAKDVIGVRHLYYSIEKDQITWSTILDPLVLFGKQDLNLCEEYVAGWLSSFPATHLTPFIGIHSVPPSCSVLLREGTCTVSRYWDFDPSRRIRYGTDKGYEEHFRTTFTEAIRRRLRSDRPILAELSGGMDSCSIVCMADVVIAGGAAQTPRLDTLSYFNDSEPNWNERPYFTKVEEKRGTVGCHIDVGAKRNFQREYLRDRFAPTPASDGGPGDISKRVTALLNSQGNRVLLSGIGGDEVLGGVPTPTPELADLLASADLRRLSRQLIVWALARRKPLLGLMAETLWAFLPYGLVGVQRHRRPASWLEPDFVKRHRTVLQGYQKRLKFFGPLPTFQENLSTLDVLRRQLACSIPSSEQLCEKRYPYLDRDLLEFIYSVPREQLVRPHQRRSLMRRALLGIVPDDVLNRKRKGFVSRSLMVAISDNLPALLEMTQSMVSSSLGIVNPKALAEVLQSAGVGQTVPLVPIVRLLGMEYWLRHLREWNLLGLPTPGGEQSWGKGNERLMQGRSFTLGLRR